MKKRIIAVGSVITLTAGIFAFSAGAQKGDSDTTDTTVDTTITTALITEAPTELETTTAAIIETITGTTTTKAAVSNKTATTSTKKTTNTTTKATTKLPAKIEKVTVPSNATASKIINGAKCVKSWNVKSSTSSAYVEKVILNLNVYDNGVKTSKTVQRYGYFAIVNTTPTSVKMIDSKQVTGKSVSSAKAIASSAGALIAVNNEMCSHDEKSFKGYYNAADDSTNGTVIKNSKIAQARTSTPSLVCYADGKWEYPVNVSPENAQELIDKGVTDSVGYTYPMIWNGEKYKLSDTNAPSNLWYDFSLRQDNAKSPYITDHTVVGQINKNKYVLAVSDGFGQGYLWNYLLDLGVQNGYWCNGGHCSVMYLKGYGAINRPTDGHPCLTADTFCIF